MYCRHLKLYLTNSNIMKIDFTKATFKDFENIPDIDAFERAAEFTKFLEFMEANGHLNYRLETLTGCGPEMEILTPFSRKKAGRYICFVSNDYLNFSQHPKIKEATITAIQKFGTGSGASPLIGGHFEYHQQLEEKIGSFFHHPKGSSAIFTTGYTANSATLLSLLKKEDIAILDSGVHTSVFEGLLGTNSKTFPHNNLELLEHALKTVKDQYRTKLVIIDGVYSQDGDVAPISDIIYLVEKYNAYIMVDDAHGVGVLGSTGRGALEDSGLFNKVHIFTGTFSKTFGALGGYIIAKPEVINFLKYQSRQQIFSSTATPAAAGISKAIDLIDEEPFWRQRLWENINYFKDGLKSLGLNIGTTRSAIVPVKIGDPHVTGDVGRMLLQSGIYTNPILYPAVPRKDARIRMSVMATHTREHLDKALNAFADIDRKLHISREMADS